MTTSTIDTTKPVTMSPVSSSVIRTNFQAAYNDITNLYTLVTPITGIIGGGMITQTSQGNYALRTITGTASQISITNGNGVSGNPTVGLASNPIIPGTGGMLPPVGGTAARASLGTGTFRFNSDLGLLEYYNGSSWSQLQATGAGAVTSVGMTGDGVIYNATIGGAPITTSGTLIPALLTQTKNTFLCGPTTGSAATPTFRAIVAADLPNPGASSLGGVQSIALVAHNFLTTISTSGVVSQAQPAFTDISGTLGSAQMPTFTGDVTNSGLAMTVAAINGATLGTTTATSGNLLIGQGATWATKAMSGDAAITLTGAITVTKTSGVAFAASATTDTTNAANISSGTILAARMPALTGDITMTIGTVATVLATVNSNVGTFNGSTVNGKGLVTAISDLQYKKWCRVATTAAFGSATYNNGSSGVGATLTNSGAQVAIAIDGVSLSVNDRVLVKNQAAPANNGIYSVTNAGSGATNWVLTRTSDFDGSTAGNVSEGAFTVITEGTVNAASIFMETGQGPFTIGTTAITFSLNNASGGNVLSVSNGDGTLTISPTTGAVVASIPSSVALPGAPTTTTAASTDNSTKLATTAYVTTAITNAIAGVNPATAVQAATTANVAGYTYNNGVSGIGATLTQNSPAAVTIDGYVLLLNDRVLFKNQSTPANNGIYFLSTLGTGIIAAIFTRALDFDQPSDMNNAGAIPVVNGTVNAETSWVLTSKVNTVGTDAATFTQFSLNPTTILTNVLNNAQIFVGNGSNVATGVSMTGDGSISNAGALTITKTNGVAFATSATTDTTVASNISSGTLPAGRMPALTGDITTSAGAVATTLATVNSNVGTFNGITLNGKGLATAATFVSSRQFCRVATTAALTATYSNGSSGVGATLTNSGAQVALSIDGVSLNANDRVLVKNQAAPANNGLYSVTNVGSGSTNWVLTRTSDFDGSTGGNVAEGAMVPVTEGTVNAASIFIESGQGPFTIGTTAITWTQNTASGVTGTATANTFLAGPTSGGPAAPAFRAIVAADMPAYTGDATSSAGATALTLATVNSNIGTFNGMTINGKGLVTAASFISSKASCRVGTTAALTATYANGSSGVGATLTNSGTQVAISIDGVSLSNGDRVLVWNQGTASQNGVYTVTTVGSGASNWVLTRASDFDGSTTGNVYEGAMVAVTEGTANTGSIFIETGSGPFTLGTTAITFSLNQAQIAAIAAGNVMSNITGGTAQPSGNTLTATMDKAFGNTAQSIVARGSSNWALVTAGTDGQGFYRKSGAIAAAFSAGQWIDVRDSGAVPDCRRITDLVCNNGSPTATSAASANFTTNDVGKVITVYDFTNGNYIARTTVLSRASATSINMNANASNNLTSANGVTYLGTDNASNINTAATAAGALLDTVSINANQSLGGGRIVLYFPTDSRGSRYLIQSATLSIPTNVIVHADAMIISAVGLGDTNVHGLANRVWGLTLSSGASINHLEMDACYGMGVIIGTNSTQSHSFINDLTVWSAGGNFDGTKSPTSQHGLGLQGNDYFINRYWVKGANVGISGFVGGVGINDTLINQLFLIGCSTGAIFNGCEEVFVAQAQCDTNNFVGIAIDACHNLRLKANAFQINATTLTSGLDVGQNSSTQNRALQVDFNAERVGTNGVRIGCVLDSKFEFNITNAANFAGGGTTITNGINFSTSQGALAGVIQINANIDSGVTNTTTGTPYGELRINSATSSVGQAPKAAGINLLYNGDCRIDQEHEGASITLASGTAAYAIDGWGAKMNSGATSVTVQRVADAPAGFLNSAKITVGTGSAVGAANFLFFELPIEGVTAQPLGFGAAGAAPVSLQFYAKSSIGSYTAYACLQNSATNRTYITAFTVTNSGTWTLITIPNIPGDITGTWLTAEATIGLRLFIVVACGSTNQSATLNAWQAAGTFAGQSPTNTILSTNGATFQATAAQLEIGTVCTPFARKKYADVIEECQRYYYKTFPPGTAPATSGGVQDGFSVWSGAAASFGGTIAYPVPMCQTATTLTTYNPSAANANWRDVTNSADRVVTVGTKGIRGVIVSGASAVASANNQIHITADARLTL